MRPTSITVSSQASSAWIPLDFKQSPFNVGMGCVVSGGATLTYKVEHTFDDVFDSTVTPTAFDHAVLVSKTSNADGNYAFPVRAVRLTVTAYTSGNVTPNYPSRNTIMVSIESYSFPPFNPVTSVRVEVSADSQTITRPGTGGILCFSNTGNAICYIKGSSGTPIDAYNTDYPLFPKTKEILTLSTQYISIVGDDNTTLIITQGTGV